MAYVYRHIRHDKNQPFYIGISKDLNYKRAYTSKGRNCLWNKVSKKTEYTVEIMLDDITWEEACKKEKEFIALYKKKTDGGMLCNISDGGDGGNLGEEVNRKHAKTIMGANNPNSFKVYQYTMDGEFVREWLCSMDIANEYNIHPSNISDCINGKQRSSIGYRWSKIKLHEE